MTFSNFIGLFFSLNMALSPLAQAQEQAQEQTKKIQAQIQVLTTQMGQSQNKLGRAIQKEGLSVVTAENQASSMEEIFSRNQNDFALVTPVDQKNRRYAVEVLTGDASDMTKLKVKLNVKEYRENVKLSGLTQITSTVVTIKAGEGAEAINLKFQHAGQFLNKAISNRYAINHSKENILSKALGLLLPRAEAGVNAEEVKNGFTKIGVIALASGVAIMVSSGIAFMIAYSITDLAHSGPSLYASRVFMVGAAILGLAAISGAVAVIANEF